jgi:hypothetical protein
MACCDNYGDVRGHTKASDDLEQGLGRSPPSKGTGVLLYLIIHNISRTLGGAQGHLVLPPS